MSQGSLEPTLSGRTWVLALGLALFLGSLAFAAQGSGVMARPEARLLDLWTVLRKPLPVDSRILLVEIDREAARAFGQPQAFWSADYARVAGALLDAGAAAVGFDVILHPQRDRLEEGSEVLTLLEDGEIALGMVIMGGQVVMGEFYQPRAGREEETRVEKRDVLRSADVLHFAASGHGNTGFLNVITDPDGVVRRMPLFWSETPPERTRTFTGRLAELATGGEMARGDGRVSLAGKEVLAEQHGTALRVQYPGVPFPTLSLSTVLQRLDRGLPVEGVEGRICLLGPGEDGYADLHPTPMDLLAGPRSLTPGLQIQAATLNTLLTGRYLVPASPGASFSWILLAALAGVALGLGFRPALALPLGAAALLGGFLAGLEGVERGQWLPGMAAASAGSASFGVGFLLRHFTLERSRRHLRAMFGRYVSPQVMEELVRNPASLALGGTRRRITVLFSDINDFTPLCERSTPEEVIEMLNRYFREMLDIIFRHGGTVKQFVGDEIMVIYGAPEPQEDHAARAVRTAVEMVERLDWLKRNKQGRPGFYEVKIGIHSGDVVVGNVGAEKRTEYAAVGDDVNLAARIESLAKTVGATLLVSETTRRECAPLLPEFEWESRGVQRFKGKTAEMEVFEVHRRGAPEEER